MVVVATENSNSPFTLNLSPDSVREIPSVHRDAKISRDKAHLIPFQPRYFLVNCPSGGRGVDGLVRCL